MAIIRLRDGDLLVWSPVTLNAELRAQVDDLGAVAYIVAPNHLHHLALGAWRAAYPTAKLHGAPRLAAKRRDLSFDAQIGDHVDPAWSRDLDHVIVRGNALTEEVVFLHRPSGTVLFCDLLQQFPAGWFHGWRKLVAKMDLMTEPKPTVPRKFRIAFRDKAAARVALGRVRGWPATGVVMAHGTPVTTDVTGFLQDAFAFLD